jgi:hypothetical protein
VALTHLARAVLDDPARRPTYIAAAVTALRRAVTLDPANAEAKANLEVLLQLSHDDAAPRASGSGRGRPGLVGRSGTGVTGPSAPSTSPPRY